MILEDMVAFQNFCSSHAMTHRNLRLGWVVEKNIKVMGKLSSYFEFLSDILIFRVKIEKFAKCECE